MCEDFRNEQGNEGGRCCLLAYGVAVPSDRYSGPFRGSYPVRGSSGGAADEKKWTTTVTPDRTSRAWAGSTGSLTSQWLLIVLQMNALNLSLMIHSPPSVVHPELLLTQGCMPSHLVV